MKNLVIVNRGNSNWGKSSSIRYVWNLLKKKYPETSNLMKDKDGDVEATVQIGKFLVGIESQGDNDSRMYESIKEFINLKCDIVVIACRTQGPSYKAACSFYEDYGWDFMYCRNEHYWGENQTEIRDKLNQEYAERVVRLIENRISGRI